MQSACGELTAYDPRDDLKSGHAAFEADAIRVATKVKASGQLLATHVTFFAGLTLLRSPSSGAKSQDGKLTSKKIDTLLAAFWRTAWPETPFSDSLPSDYVRGVLNEMTDAVARSIGKCSVSITDDAWFESEETRSRLSGLGPLSSEVRQLQSDGRGPGAAAAVAVDLEASPTQSGESKDDLQSNKPKPGRSQEAPKPAKPGTLAGLAENDDALDEKAACHEEARGNEAAKAAAPNDVARAPSAEEEQVSAQQTQKVADKAAEVADQSESTEKIVEQRVTFAKAARVADRAETAAQHDHVAQEGHEEEGEEPEEEHPLQDDAEVDPDESVDGSAAKRAKTDAHEAALTAANAIEVKRAEKEPQEDSNSAQKDRKEETEKTDKKVRKTADKEKSEKKDKKDKKDKKQKKDKKDKKATKDKKSKADIRG